MTEPSLATTALDILRLPSQVRLVFGVTVAGLVVVVALVSAIGAMLVLGASALLQHFQPGQSVAMHCFNAFALILAGQIAIVPTLSFLQVLARPAIIRWRHRTYELSELDGETHTRFENLISHAGVRPVPRLLTSDRKVAPQVFGGFSPCLLIPRRLLLAIPGEELGALLLHELAHIQNKDVLIAEVANALVRSLAASATVLLALLGIVLLSWPIPDLALHVRDPMWFFAEPIKYDVSYIPGTMLVCVGALALSAAILRIGHSITMLLRERRADLRVRHFSSSEFTNLLMLVGRGTGRPGFLARALQLGPDRWTRHEALVEPHRLIRPNMPFMLLFGSFYGLLAGLLALLLNSLAEINSLAGQVPGIAGLLPLTLDRPSVFKLWVLGLGALDLVILGWLLIIQLSYSILIPLGFRNALRLLGWYCTAFMVFRVGVAAPLAITLGFPSPTLILGFLLLIFCAWNVAECLLLFSFSPMLFFVWVLQKKMLNAHYLIPRFRRATARWLVYLPVMTATCLALLPQLVANIRNPRPLVRQAEFLIEYGFYIPTPGAFVQLLGSWVSLGREYYANYLSLGLPFAVVILLLLLVAFQCLNFFRRCFCCGEELDLEFAPDCTCGRCGYPLGAWVTAARLPNPDEHLKRRGLVRIRAFPTRDLIIVLTLLALICGPALFCYRAFNTQSLAARIPSGVARVLLGIPGFLALASILFLGAALIFNWLGWLESEKTDSTSRKGVYGDASENPESYAQSHDKGD